MDTVYKQIEAEYGAGEHICALAEECEKQIKDVFEEIDRVRDYNQLKVLRSMQKNGYVEKSTDEGDQRRKRIMLTEKGKEASRLLSPLLQ